MPAALPPKPATPKARKGMDADWHHIDLSDIIYEQTQLRGAIQDAIEDGDVDKAEMTTILNHVKRARLGKVRLRLIR